MGEVTSYTKEMIDELIEEASKRVPTHHSLLAIVAPVVWNAMPAAVTEFNAVSRIRTYIDLTNATQARLIARVNAVGAAASALTVRFSIDNEVTWTYLDGTGGEAPVPGGPAVSLAVANTTKKSNWVDLAEVAKADVAVQVVGYGGDGVASPSLSNIALQLR